jgi:predicted kinase
MVGAPGSGKSTYAKKLAQAEDAIIISGDSIRNELYGSPEIQGNWDQIWSRIDLYISQWCHRNIIIDGTHYRQEYREEIYTLLKSYGFDKIEAIVMDASLATCLSRNFQRRDRNVPDYIVKEMHSKLQKSLRTIISEPFDRISFVY